MLPCIILTTECKRRLQIQDLHRVLTTRTHRAHNALEDPQYPPQRAMQTPSPGVVFVHVQNDRRRMAFYAMAQCAHSAYTELLAIAWRAPRRSAIVLDAVETL